MAGKNVAENLRDNEGKTLEGVERTGDSSEISAAEKGEGKLVHYLPTIPECVICLQLCHHPVMLPCSHIFCFLCVKGVAARSRKCALCRAEVPEGYFQNPVVVELQVKQQSPSVDLNAWNGHCQPVYKWFYEGRNGWWQYEERASDQIEEAFSDGQQTIEVLIAGFGYIIDIENMVQYRKNYPTRRRRIKRDKCQADKKGVAGLKSATESQRRTTVQTQSVAVFDLETSLKTDLEEEVTCVTEKMDTI